MLIASSGNLLLKWVRSLPVDEPLQLSLPDKSFDLLLLVIAVGRVMIVFMVETAILVSRPLIRISLQLTRKGQGSFVLDLHQDLVDRGNQRAEAHELPCGKLRAPVLPPFFSPSHLLPLSCRTSSCLSLFLDFSSRGQKQVFRVHVLSRPVKHI